MSILHCHRDYQITVPVPAGPPVFLAPDPSSYNGLTVFSGCAVDDITCITNTPNQLPETYTASGGLGPGTYTWQLTGAPPGSSITATGPDTADVVIQLPCLIAGGVCGLPEGPVDVTYSVKATSGGSSATVTTTVTVSV